MFLLVRDEDIPTVAAAIRAYADEEGLEPIDVESQAQNPLAMLSVLTGPRVFLTSSETHIAAFGLETLDIAEPEEWGTEVSTSCETEVVVLAPAEDGVRVYVFDGGELDEEIEIPLDRSGRTRAKPLVELTDDADGRRALADGIPAQTASELVAGILNAFGVRSPGADTHVLAFLDPLDDDDTDDAHDAGDADDGSAATTAFSVDALPAAALEGRVGGSVDSLNGSLFAIMVERGGPVEGVRLELSGDGLDLFDVESVDVAVRRRGAQQLEPRTVKVASTTSPIVVALDDAYLERADFRPPSIDPTDMFATMQRLMSAGEARKLNTLIVDVRGIAKKKGEGTLTLAVAGTDAEASVPVHVR